MPRPLLMALMLCAGLWFGPSTVSGHPEAWDDRQDEAPDAEAPPDFDRLSAYGDWVWEPAHGRVWRPYVEANWRPYWRGHWSRHGEWVWVSADPWGSAPFHYGEWAWSVRFGWVWIPGTVWAPARVTWIVDGPVIAWAPASVHITFGSDHHRHWVYADRDQFHRHVVRPHRLPPAQRHVHRGAVIRDFDRVVTPHRPSQRTFRIESPRERTQAVNMERRAIAKREDRQNRRFTVESPGESRRGAGSGRGFEHRGAR
ncbi:MAG: DUF6600 domain-containing protein [Nitrospirota bacterium]